MRDTDQYGTAHSGRIQFGRQAAVVSALAPVAYVGLMAANVLVILRRSQSTGAIITFLACFLALVGLVLGLASRYSLRSRRHGRFLTFGIIGITASVLFLVGTLAYFLIASRGAT